MRRMIDLARVAWGMAAYAVLGLLWLAWFQAFCANMLPRLDYLTGEQRAVGIDRPCIKPECDFSDFWRAGLSARLPVAEASKPLHLALQAGVQMPMPGGYQEGFPYPPPMFLPVALISFLPFELGFFVWIGAWLALAVLALRWAKLSWPAVLLGLLSPAALWNTELGQMGIIGGALLVAGLLALAEKPLRGGLLLGLLACKPQIGIMVPAALLGSRSGRGAAGFVLACAGLVLLTLAVFGWPLWQGYLAHGRQGGAHVLNAVFVPHLASGSGVCVFWMLRSLHASLPLAAAGQAVSSTLAMLLTIWVRRREDVSRLDALALTVFLSLLATPYGYVDDMVAWSLVLAALARARGWRIGMLDVLFWMWPAVCLLMSEATGVLWTPLVVALAVARTWYRAGLPLPHLPRRAPVLPRA